jgi:MYXO-CTERM domain-containing protein
MTEPMAGSTWQPDDDIGAGAPPDVLARARRVGPDADDDDAAPLPDRELEPWELPPAPPPRPRLRERSLDDVFERIRALTLPQARAFLRAYQALPPAELGLDGSAPTEAASSERKSALPSVDQIVTGRAVLREGAIREARASGADLDPGPMAVRTREAVVEALAHARLRGGGLEEATVAAEVAAQDVAVALTVRSWISEWRFQELVDPWVAAYSEVAVEAHSFDVLGALGLALAVMAVATFGLGRSSVNASDLPAIAFALLAALVLLARWRTRRTGAAA